MTSSVITILKDLDEREGEAIERWFVEKRAQALPFFTTSVDLRHSGLRLAPVDTNLYPAGFNNLSPAARERASRFIRRFLDERGIHAKRVLIVPENHTRNMGYLENLATILSLFDTLGIEAQLGSMAAKDAPIELETPSGVKLTEYPILREGARLSLANGQDTIFTPDLIVMNNDMTSGAPEILVGVEQPLTPPVNMGWWQRRKSVHFAAYEQLIDDFCKEFGFDPWLFNAGFHRCGMVDFKEQTGLDCMANGVAKVLDKAREKHREYGIAEDPYVFIKAESGTYGMGIMTVKSPEEVLELNKKTRNKMQTIKEGAHVSDVIIQEGIPTVDALDGRPAEPMVYMIDGVPVGGMYRVNGSRDAYGNLNAAGMEFAGMCDAVEDECGRWKAVANCDFRAFGIIAAIAALAAAREDYHEGQLGSGI